MKYVVWLLLAPLSLVFKLIGWLFAIPLGLLVGLTNMDRLPNILSWFGTPDDDAYGSKTRAERMGDPSGKPDKVFKRVRLAIWWLFRNPGYGFCNGPLGVEAGTRRVVKSTDRSIKFEIVTPNGREYFGLRIYKFHIAIGWDWHVRDGRHKIEFGFNPFKSD